MSILVEVCVWSGKECWEGWKVAFDSPPMAGDEIFLPGEIIQWCKADFARIDSRSWDEDGSMIFVHAVIEKRTEKSATQINQGEDDGPHRRKPLRNAAKRPGRLRK